LRYQNTNSAVFDVIRNGGLRSFWRGTTMTCATKFIQQFAAPIVLYQLHKAFSPAAAPDLSK